jgi:hypothetical protein
MVDAYTSSEASQGINSLGSFVSLNIKLANTLDIMSTGFDGIISFSSGVSPEQKFVSFPSIPEGDSAIVVIEGLQILGNEHEYSAIGSIADLNGNELFEIGLKIEPINIIASIIDDGISGLSVFSPTFQIENYSAANYSDINILIQSLSNGVEVIEDNSLSTNQTIPPFSTSLYQTDYTLSIGDIPSGSTITLLFQLQNADSVFYSNNVEFSVGSVSQNVPVSPSEYGYWAYDDTDVDFDLSPTFEWVELDPSFGGFGANEYLLDDDDHVTIQLPFQVQYHGELFNEMTINSNGWASLVPCDIDYFWNMSIPSFMSPKGMLAPFWDDLEVVGEDWIRVYTRHDEGEGKFIIEWSRALNGYDEITEETFEIIIHDTNTLPTLSGDNVIDFQYLEIYDVDVTKNYSTVGIQSPRNNDGLSIIFNNNYSSGAAELVNGRAIRFTTDAPDSYVSPLGVDDDKQLPKDFSISSLFPNPFNPIINFNLQVINNESISIKVFDMMGRLVNNIHSGTLVAGNYNFSWDGKIFNNTKASSGTYFLVVSNGVKKDVKKMLLLK